MKNILTGHVSPETAFVVNDYPYGFRLRCKIRYWLEHHPKHGTRFVSQTTNPKKSALVDIWNKPKASTYSALAGAMFTDEKGHVHWVGIGYYSEVPEIKAWMDEYGFTLPEAVQTKVNRHLSVKQIYEAEKARGEFDYQGAGMVSVLVGAKRKDGTTLTLEQAQAAVRKQISAKASATSTTQQTPA